MLGLAMRAGKLILGTDMICRAMPKRGAGAVRLAVLSDTASTATKEKITKKGAFYGVPVITAPIDMSELGRMLGKTYAPAAVAVTDEGFAKEITRLAELAGATAVQILRKEVSDTGNGD